MTESNHGTTSDYEVDRISYLPQPIIHDILSLLPTEDATRTSLLSKTFYSHWTSFPVIDLDFFLFNHGSRDLDVLDLETFIDYSLLTMERRRIHSDLQKFGLRFPGANYIDPEREHLLDEMIIYAIENNVKELAIDFLYILDINGGYLHPLTIPGVSSITKLSISGARFKTNDLPLDDLPQLNSLHISECCGLEVFKLSSSVIRSIELGPCRGLTSIDIESPSLEIFIYEDFLIASECEINISSCKSLKKLSLSDATVNDSWISYNIHSFPGLEELTLIDCKNMEYLNVWNDNLRTIRVGHCPILQSIGIKSENLQSLALVLCEACKINISSCKYLTELSLEVYDIDDKRGQELLDEFLKEQVTKLIQLERFELGTDLKYNRIEFKHERLKRLELSFRGHIGWHGLGEVVVDTPNLVSLNYHGCFTSLQLLNSDARLDTRVKLGWHEINERNEYFSKMLSLIGSVSQSRSLTLACFNEKDLILSEEMKEKLCGRRVDNRDHLNVFFDHQQGISAELLDSLLWLWPSLKTLCLDKRSIKFQHAMTSEEKDPCWRRSL